MKKTVKNLLTLLLLLTTLLAAVSCGGGAIDPTLWDSATYKENTTFGDGETTVEVEVRVEENAVTFTIKTDMSILGAALLEHNLIAGEQGIYGLYVKNVNGITADYDVDKSYWSFYKDGEYLMSGVDTTVITDGDHYEIVYTKE
jgi:hypothetical protein